MKYLLMFLFSQFALAGGFVGNGAEDFVAEEGSWFVAGGPVKWCLKDPENTDLDYSTIHHEIERAFAKWEEYVERKNPFRKTAPGFKLQFSEICNGGEDITVYFGHDSPEISKEKAKYENPIAFVKRTSYDWITGRGKGFIWINSNPAFSWRTYPNLLAITLHEIGHILGSEHVEGTIMDGRIKTALRNNLGTIANRDDYDSQYALNSLLQIDFTKELFLNATDGIQIWGYRGMPNPEVNELFKTLIDYIPKGPVSIGFIQGWEEKNDLARLYFIEVNPNREVDAKGTLKFQKWILNIKLDPILELLPISEGRVFKVEGETDVVAYEKVRGYTRTGVLILPNGKQLPILYNRNRADDVVVDIYYRADDGQYRPLFKASPLQQLGDQRVFKD